MQAKIQKWGNSHAVRIPKLLVKEARLSYGSPIELSMEEEKIVIEPRENPAISLEALLKGVSKHNLHGETDTGKPVGREAW